MSEISLTHCNLIFAHGISNGARTVNPCRDLKISAMVYPQEPPKQCIALGRGWAISSANFTACRDITGY